ncbi:MAG: SIMPL domain-containing protein [Anaerolineaceae bacterium]|nr:SIMPL domain-containing protein [Anaerolineaceae bacterium]
MRNKFLLVMIAALMISLLSACGPAAKAFTNSNALNSGTSLPGGIQPQGQIAPTGGVLPQGQPTPVPGIRSLVVSGTGRATLTPDIAYVNIGVHTENADVAEALASNTAQAQKVADAIRALGVDAKDIQTTNFNIYPMQTYGPNNEVTGTKYAVDNSVYVTVRDLSKLGNLLDAAVKNGANSINGVQFDVADKSAALSDARKAAVKDAQSQAQELASAAGVTLGAVQSINTSNNSVPLPIYAGMGMGGGGARAEAAQVPVSSGQLIITVDVNLVYEIK